VSVKYLAIHKRQVGKFEIAFCLNLDSLDFRILRIYITSNPENPLIERIQIQTKFTKPLMKNITTEKYDGMMWEQEKLPFALKRVYWISNVPTNTIRGTHAHRECEEVLYVLKGEIEVKLIDNQRNTEILTLQKGQRIYIPVMAWKEITFSNDAILIVYASTEYNEHDYVYEDEFFGK
jgi:mannose-6-phosphate isomerase-like protein (cupin superfamily)